MNSKCKTEQIKLFIKSLQTNEIAEQIEVLKEVYRGLASITNLGFKYSLKNSNYYTECTHNCILEYSAFEPNFQYVVMDQSGNKYTVDKYSICKFISVLMLTQVTDVSWGVENE